MNLRWKFLDAWHDAGLLILRVAAGGMIFGFHGFPMLSQGGKGWTRTGEVMSYLKIENNHLWWGFAAMCAMTLGAIALILGLAHRVACLLLFVTMAMATLSLYLPDRDITDAAYPLLMTVTCVSLFILGPGKYAVDKP